MGIQLWLLGVSLFILLALSVLHPVSLCFKRTFHCSNFTWISSLCCTFSDYFSQLQKMWLNSYWVIYKGGKKLYDVSETVVIKCNLINMFTPYFLIKIQILNENYITADESDVETQPAKRIVFWLKGHRAGVARVINVTKSTKYDFFREYKQGFDANH